MNNVYQNRPNGICPHCKKYLIVNPANPFERCPFCHNRYDTRYVIEKCRPFLQRYYPQNNNSKSEIVRNQADSTKRKKWFETTAIGALAILGVICIFGAFNLETAESKKESTNMIKANNEIVDLHEGEIQLVDNYSEYIGKYYKNVVIRLKNNGFTNVKIQEKEVEYSDLNEKLSNSFESVSINGKKYFYSGQWYPSDTDILVYYYKTNSPQTTAENKKTIITTDTRTSETDKPNNSKKQNEVTPEFKQMMDNYEAFFDEYISFMEKLGDDNDSTDFSALGDYFSMLEKEAKIMSEMEAIDEKELSDADEAYYVEVTARISQKLMKATFSLF